MERGRDRAGAAALVEDLHHGQCHRRARCIDFAPHAHRALLLGPAAGARGTAAPSGSWSTWRAGLAAAGHRVTLLAGRRLRRPRGDAGAGGPRAGAAPRPSTSGPLLPAGLDLAARLRAAPNAARRALDPAARGQLEAGHAPARRTRSTSAANHAQRHGGDAFVYNGIDPAEFRVPPATRRLRPLPRPAAQR